MKLMRVTKPELQFVEERLIEVHNKFEAKVIKNVEQLWSNQHSLKEGLDVAEFHLRAYRRLLADIVGQLNGEGQVATEEVATDRKDDKGELVKRKVVNLRFYFELAKAELQRIAEMERAAQEKVAVGEAVAKLNEKTAAELEVIVAKLESGERVLQVSEAEAVSLMDDTRTLAIQLLQEAIRVKKAPPVQEALAAPDDGHPDGAAIFGGEHAPSDQGNEGQQEVRGEGSDSGGEHRPPSELPQGPVSDVQVGDGGVRPQQAEPDGL